MKKTSPAHISRRSLILGGIPLLISAIGCQSLIFTAAYLIKGRDVDPEYNFLKKGEKKIVVICRSSAMNQFQTETVPREITKKVSNLLKNNVKNKKLEVVDYRKVEQWLDDCSQVFEDFDQIGADFKADYVIGIELQAFQVRESTSTMQGKANWVVKTYDMNKDEVVGEKIMTLVDPPSSPIPIRSNADVAMFQRVFVDAVSKQIAALYHPHDPNKIYKRIDADVMEFH